MSSHARRPLLAFAALLLTATFVASCSNPARKKDPPTENPEIAQNMRQINLFGAALQRAVDDADIPIVRSTVASINTSMSKLVGLPPKPVAGQRFDVDSWNAAINESNRVAARVAAAAEHNRWDLVAKGYDTLRLACIRCHEQFGGKAIEIAMPPTRNY